MHNEETRKKKKKEKSVDTDEGAKMWLYIICVLKNVCIGAYIQPRFLSRSMGCWHTYRDAAHCREYYYAQREGGREGGGVKVECGFLFFMNGFS